MIPRIFAARARRAQLQLQKRNNSSCFVTAFAIGALREARAH